MTADLQHQCTIFYRDDEKETDEETAEVLQMKHELSETLSDFRKQILEKMKARKVKHSLSDQVTVLLYLP